MPCPSAPPPDALSATETAAGRLLPPMESGMGRAMVYSTGAVPDAASPGMADADREAVGSTAPSPPAGLTFSSTPRRSTAPAMAATAPTPGMSAAGPTRGPATIGGGPSRSSSGAAADLSVAPSDEGHNAKAPPSAARVPEGIAVLPSAAGCGEVCSATSDNATPGLASLSLSRPDIDADAEVSGDTATEAGTSWRNPPPVRCVSGAIPDVSDSASPSGCDVRSCGGDPWLDSLGPPVAADGGNRLTGGTDAAPVRAAACTEAEGAEPSTSRAVPPGNAGAASDRPGPKAGPGFGPSMPFR